MNLKSWFITHITTLIIMMKDMHQCSHHMIISHMTIQINMIVNSNQSWRNNWVLIRPQLLLVLWCKEETSNLPKKSQKFKFIMHTTIWIIMMKDLHPFSIKEMTSLMITQITMMKVSNQLWRNKQVVSVHLQLWCKKKLLVNFMENNTTWLLERRLLREKQNWLSNRQK